MSTLPPSPATTLLRILCFPALPKACRTCSLLPSPPRSTSKRPKMSKQSSLKLNHCRTRLREVTSRTHSPLSLQQQNVVPPHRKISAVPEARSIPLRSSTTMSQPALSPSKDGRSSLQLPSSKQKLWLNTEPPHSHPLRQFPRNLLKLLALNLANSKTG